MFKSIITIRNYSVYKNYKKPAKMQNFGVKNLIYGWNYSGKTSLSRIFSQIEKKRLNNDLINCSFSIETDSSEPITEFNFQKSSELVKVFNSDFINENLNFLGEQFNPILILGEEAKQLQKLLLVCQDKIKTEKEKKRHLEDLIRQLDISFSERKKEVRSNISQLHSYSSEYTDERLSDDIEMTRSSNRSFFLSPSELEKNKQITSISGKMLPPEPKELYLNRQFIEIFKRSQTLLSKRINCDTITYLKNDTALELWIEHGILIHENTDECKFCNNKISKDKIIKLKQHFSKDLTEHKYNIRDLQNKIDGIKFSIRDLPRVFNFLTHLRPIFEAIEPIFTEKIAEYNENLDLLRETLQKKYDTPFEPIELPNISYEDIFARTHDIIAKTNELTKENNNSIINIVQEQQNAWEAITYHHVQEFLNSERDGNREDTIATLANELEKVNYATINLTQEKERILNDINNSQLGIEKINARISNLLGGNSIQIKLVNNSGLDRFQIFRTTGEVAKYLSDGEKMAIAFSYFLTNLEKLPNDEFKNTIVYIDDPISSLDNNHIFQIASIIRELFFHQAHINKNIEWTTRCKQIFISTHNFEFFNLLREIKPANKKSPLFLIQRINDTESVITDMPRSLSKYGSEYHFLFDVIYKFSKSPEKNNYAALHILPNAVRRFVELYTYSKIPGNTEETVDQRAELLFGKERSSRILKMLHYFSHSNNIERMHRYSDFIFNLSEVIDDLLNLIKQDDLRHWNALISATAD